MLTPILGTIASVLCISCYIPQLIEVYQTKSLRSVNLGFFLLLTMSIIAGFCYTASLPGAMATFSKINYCISLSLSGSLTTLKIAGIIRKKRLKQVVFIARKAVIETRNNMSKKLVNIR